MSKNKYIKLVVYPQGNNIFFYRVIETKNINFVEPGYEYQLQRPKTFKNLFEPEYLKDAILYSFVNFILFGRS